MTAKLDNKFTVVTTPSVITYLLFNRASLDYIKSSKAWMFSSKGELKFTNARNAARIAKVMRRYGNI